MAGNLTKIIGRSAVTKYREEKRTVWVDPPPKTPTPPPTPPIGTTTPPGNVFVPFVGGSLTPCIRADGKRGYMMTSTLADGTVIRSGICIVSDGLGV